MLKQCSSFHTRNFSTLSPSALAAAAATPVVPGQTAGSVLAVTFQVVAKPVMSGISGSMLIYHGLEYLPSIATVRQARSRSNNDLVRRPDGCGGGSANATLPHRT